MTVERFFWGLIGVGAFILGFWLIDDAIHQRMYRAACCSEGVAPAECRRIFP